MHSHFWNTFWKRTLFCSVFCNYQPNWIGSTNSLDQIEYSKTCLKRTCFKVDTWLKGTKIFGPGRFLVKFLWNYLHKAGTLKRTSVWSGQNFEPGGETWPLKSGQSKFLWLMQTENSSNLLNKIHITKKVLVRTS